MKQRTLHTTVKATGIATHSGERVELTLHPAPVNTGILFRRIDLTPQVIIPASVQYVSDTIMSTTLGYQGAKISTVEHLLSAFAGLGVDNAYVDVTASEIPIMDGSASSFTFLIQLAGIKEQAGAEKRFIRIKRRMTEKEGDKWVALEPYDKGLKLEFTIDFGEHPAFTPENNHVSIRFSSTAYNKEISRARTFGFVSDLEKLQAMNLAKGANLSNTLAFDQYRVLNEEGLRYEDECARHKILDAIGDLSLLGACILGSFKGYKSGHALNNRLLKKLLADQKAWEYVTFPHKETSPVTYIEPVLVR